LTDLRALLQPPGDEAELDSMHASVGELSNITRSIAAALADSDTAKAKHPWPMASRPRPR
jgi:hypothetical protein